MMTATQKRLSKWEDEDGDLIAYACPGGYPVYYLDADNSVLCPKCANEDYKNPEDAPAAIVDGDINWEGEMQCDHCYEEIESAYDDPDEDA